MENAPSPTHLNPSPALLNVQELAALLKCSTRTVYRLSDGGLLPRPRKLGALVRWSSAEVHEWIAGGCKPVRRSGCGGCK